MLIQVTVAFGVLRLDMWVAIVILQYQLDDFTIYRYFIHTQGKQSLEPYRLRWVDRPQFSICCLRHVSLV